MSLRTHSGSEKNCQSPLRAFRPDGKAVLHRLKVLSSALSQEYPIARSRSATFRCTCPIRTSGESPSPYSHQMRLPPNTTHMKSFAEAARPSRPETRPQTKTPETEAPGVFIVDNTRSHWLGFASSGCPGGSSPGFRRSSRPPGSAFRLVT